MVNVFGENKYINLKKTNAKIGIKRVKTSEMVRKRAPAQKALSPTKDIPSIPERQLSNEYKLNNNGKGDISLGSPIEIEKIEPPNPPFDFLDELPEFESFPIELSEKSKEYWNSLQQDYNDFTSWTCLLQTTCETENNLPAAEAVFKCFLRYYPYCYGYWKKFADIEKKHGNLDRVLQIFQNGVKSISVSIDLWVHYLNFYIHQNRDRPNGESEIRKLFNSAIETAGLDFKSNKLWDAYIQWEKSMGNLKRVTEIYDRLIATPNQQYIKNWTKFKHHLESNSPADVLTTEEYMKVMHELDIVPPGMTTEEDLSIHTAIPALDIVNKDEYKSDSNEELSESEKSIQKNSDLIRKKVIAERESIFLLTANEIKKRWKFEESIKRPYFHVKPLEKTQLKNWREYLDYEMSEGHHKKIVNLFERCMVVCALYEEFWQRFIDYAEERDIELTRSIYYRACNIHMLKKYNMHIKWAVFEEKQKKYENASQILSNVDCNFPGMILITQHRIGLARRMKRFDEIESIYENAIKAADRIEDKIFYSIKFSHVLAKFCGDKSKARLVLLDALKLGKKQKRLYLQLLDLEMHYGSVEDEHVLSLFNSVENDMSLSEEVRQLFAQRKVEFYEEYSNDIQSVIEVRESFEAQQSKQYNSSKRKLSECAIPESSNSKKVNNESVELSSIPVPNVPTLPQMPQPFSYNPENPALYSNDQQGFYNWESYQQFQNFGHQ